MKLLRLLFSAAALLAALGTARADGPVSFLVAGTTTGSSPRFETFVVTVSDPSAIGSLRYYLPNVFFPRVAVRIAAGVDGVNRDEYSSPARAWSWRVTEVLAVESQVQPAVYPPLFPPQNLPGPAYSGAPSDIEADPAGWIARNGDVIAFERFRVVGEVASNPDRAAKPTLLNYSTRGVVGTGEQTLIGGLVISEGGVASRVAATSILVFSENSYASNGIVYPVAGNERWQDNFRAAELQARYPSLVPGSPQESALLLNLAPGAYTIHVKGAGGAPGVALLEIYGTRP